LIAKRGNAVPWRATRCLGALLGGYFALAVVAGARNSPLTVLLPAGTGPPRWAAALAKLGRLNHVGRGELTGVSWLLVIAVLAAFAILVREAWSGRVPLFAALAASGIGLAIAVAAPLLLSHDVLTYAAYGRVQAVYHHNPYGTRLSAFRHDPFVSVTPGQWLHTHSPYGPVFTLLSAAIARSAAGSTFATIFAFKLIAGLAVAAATGLVAWIARRTRPERASLAVVLVALNPVVVVHTVGGGHVDALIAAPLAAAAAFALTRTPGESARALAVTVLLTLACLVKAVMVPALVLWLWWLAKTERIHRARRLVAQTFVVCAATAASLTPYVAGVHTLTPLASLGGVESWASPSHLVGRGAEALVRALAGSRTGSVAATAVEAAFLLFFLILLWRLGRSARDMDPPPVAGWAAALLLLALSMPYLLPWYAVWFAPFLGLLGDEPLVSAGAFVTGVLALTLIPADPLHGLTSPAVMDGVHYGVAPLLLAVFLVLASRVLRSGDRVAASLSDARRTAVVDSASGTAGAAELGSRLSELAGERWRSPRSRSL
jgi:hypothetical protein